jgi:hypothetical protein
MLCTLSFKIRTNVLKEVAMFRGCGCESKDANHRNHDFCSTLRRIVARFVESKLTTLYSEEEKTC